MNKWIYGLVAVIYLLILAGHLTPCFCRYVHLAAPFWMTVCAGVAMQYGAGVWKRVAFFALILGSSLFVFGAISNALQG